MRIMALIDEAFVIEKILRHLGLWEEEPLREARPPPDAVEEVEIAAEPFLDDLPYGDWEAA